jgi:hypothetical protein
MAARTGGFKVNKKGFLSRVGLKKPFALALRGYA